MEKRLDTQETDSAPKPSQFSTPISTRKRPQQEQTPDAATPSSTSSSTPVGRRGRGRPRKELVPPTFDDMPENATKEELNKWKKAKTTELWRSVPEFEHFHVYKPKSKWK